MNRKGKGGGRREGKKGGEQVPLQLAAAGDAAGPVRSEGDQGGKGVPLPKGWSGSSTHGRQDRTRRKPASC